MATLTIRILPDEIRSRLRGRDALVPDADMQSFPVVRYFEMA